MPPCPPATRPHPTAPQAIDKLRLEGGDRAGARPKAVGMESCVGTEYVPFKTPLALEGKVRGGGALVGSAGGWGCGAHRGHCTAGLLAGCCRAPFTLRIERPHMASHALTCPHTCPVHLQVEAYMARVVGKMRAELRGILRDSVRDYPAKPRDKWMYDWPGQIILVS